MVDLLSPAGKAQLRPSETSLLRLPVPVRVISNGEFTPGPQTARQREVEARTLEHLSTAAAKLNLPVDQYASTASGFAAAFMAMNESHGAHFTIAKGEVDDPESANERAAALVGQFVFDDQVHFLRDDADPAAFNVLGDLIDLTRDLLGLEISRSSATLDQVKFLNFVKEIYLDSDTHLALLSGFPSDQPNPWVLDNDQMAAAKAAINKAAGSTRLLSHAVFTPGQDGWLDEMDRVHAIGKPDGWKGYTVGEPFSPSRHRWRLDDAALAYPAYERMLKAGVRNVCIHKGLLPADADVTMPGAEAFAGVSDVVRAARDFPDLNFIIYHAGYRTIPAPTEAELVRFEATGRIDWVSDLAEMPAKYGLKNIYADIGACFAFTCVLSPRLCAGMLGTLIAGLGADHVLWGTDSVWYGSPQWQIEAFRRLEIPEDLQRRFGYAPLGGANSPVKTSILGQNAARLYGVSIPTTPAEGLDDLQALKRDYLDRGGQRSNLSYGYINPD